MLSSTDHASTTTTNSHQTIPKIQTESKNDILYLQSILNEFVSKELEKVFPSSSGESGVGRDGEGQSEKEKEREKVKEILDLWIQETFVKAGPNISINGIDYESAFKKEEEYTPLDSSLLSTLSTLEQELDQVSVSVMKKRSKWVDQICLMLEDVLKREADGVDGLSPLDDEMEVDENVKDQEQQEQSSKFTDIQTTVQELEKSLGLLKELENNLPTNLAKLERVNDVLNQEMNS
ncbi:hypothetical protein BKA69DRAFT_1170119 [Paraphysoderma sedebokerense]|nr:hypothetical protein BKA69DRAFT_1170119 [Paraphysoderma sedebokerense]